MSSNNSSIRKLQGEELVNVVRDNREKPWLEIIERCGYLGSQFCVPGPNGWTPVKAFTRVQLFREFYTEYAKAAEVLIRDAYEIKYWNRLNWKEKEGPISEGEDAKKLFLEVTSNRCSEILAPSFWECDHGRVFMIMIALGGYWFRQKSQVCEAISYRGGYLRKSLINQGVEEEKLDVLQKYFSFTSYKAGYVENELYDSLHWIDVFKSRYPELTDALLGEELKNKWNDLQARQVSRAQAAFECGFIDATKAMAGTKNLKPDLRAFGFALNCSLSKTEVFLKEDGSRSYSSEVESNTDPASHSEGWPSGTGWGLDEPQMPIKPELDQIDLDDFGDEFNRQKSANENKEKLIIYKKLTGRELLNKCLDLYREGVAETSICIRTGYSTDSIGVFRRAFSKASGAELAPLARMISSLNQDSGPLIAITQERKLSSALATFRLRSSGFRDSVLNAHSAECQVCGMKFLDLIEAAHIVPVANDGVDDPSNGLPLCPTHHSAFDRYLFTFDPVDKSVVFKDGLNASMLGITKAKLVANVSPEALKMRSDLFHENNSGGVS